MKFDFKKIDFAKYSKLFIWYNVILTLAFLYQMFAMHTQRSEFEERLERISDVWTKRMHVEDNEITERISADGGDYVLVWNENKTGTFEELHEIELLYDQQEVGDQYDPY